MTQVTPYNPRSADHSTAVVVDVLDADEVTLPAPYAQPVRFRKPVETIAIVPKHGYLTYLHKKLFNALLAHAQQILKDARNPGLESFVVPLSAITSDVEFDSNNTEYLKEQFRRMVTTLVEWNAPGKSWEASGLIASAGIAKSDDGRVLLKWSYPAPIRRVLLNPGSYTLLTLSMLAVWRSQPSAQLYEICMRYETNPGGLTNRESWQWWESVLCGKPSQIAGAKEYKYFKRDTLRPAIAEVNRRQAAFDVQLIEHKQGRRVVEIQFRVLARAQAALELPPTTSEEYFDAELHKRLMSVLGVSAMVATELLADSEEDHIRMALDLTAKRLKDAKKEKVSSPLAYYKTVVKKGYANPTQLAAPRKAPVRMAGGDQQDILQRLKDEFDRDRRAQVKAIFEGREPADQVIAYEEYETTSLESVPAAIRKGWSRDATGRSKATDALFGSWLTAKLFPSPPSEAELWAFGAKKGLFTLAAGGSQ